MQLTLSTNWQVVALVIAAITFGILLMVVVRRLRRRRSAPAVLPKLQPVDVSQLGELGPAPDARRVEIYGTPVRVADVVMAPLGLGSMLPAPAKLPEILENVVPGLQAAVQSHDAIIVTWPEQLSWHGFSQAFFTHVPLPGDRGKGTPWCSIAGKFSSGSIPFVAGLICRSATANSLGQIIVEREGQWLDILRVRSET